MQNHGFDREGAIVALATGWKESALAVIRASGPGSVEMAAGLLAEPAGLSSAAGGTIRHARLMEPGSGELLDEATIAVHRAPKSYTGEDSVEIICHGSLPGIARILAACEKLGFRRAEGGEFTFRAFMNGKLGLSEAEAVQDIVLAKTEEARTLALRRLSGGLQRGVAGLRAELLGMLASVEVQLDYAEDDDLPDMELPLARLEEITDELGALSASFQTGKLYGEGIRIALSGRTNAGKSSLFNLFLKEERAIVSEVHGTTRDYLDAWIDLGGIPCLLFDTAGLREAADPVEAEGIARSEAVIDQADLVLYLIDGEKGFAEADRDFIRSHGYLHCVVVWNKADLAPLPAGEDCVPLSAASGTGFPDLVRLLAERITKGKRAERGMLTLGTERQKLQADRAIEALESVRLSALDGMPLDIVAPELQEAVEALGEITGESVSAEVLSEIFSKFCVGK